jgi:peptidylprolyl isomerase
MQTAISKITAAAAGLAVAATVACAADESLPDGLYAEIQTSKGTILARLEFEKAPLTVANFVGLAEGTKDYAKTPGEKPSPQGKPFYDGLIFHRVIPGFMIQGGCPQGTGTGGPGYRFPDEFDPSLRHDGPGVLSMANAGPGSNGSQFFITHVATPHLDDKHSVFGRVVQGQDVVNAIGDVPRDGNDRPREPVTIQHIKIRRIGPKAAAFKGDQAHFDDLLKAATAKQAAAAQARAEQAKQQIEAFIADLKQQHPDKELVTTASGLRYLVTAEGQGEKPARGTVVQAHYTGRLPDGTVFDSSLKRGKPFEFPVGMGRVIPGWDEALADMKKGEKRVLIIPPQLAYGARGAGGVIPPNATLIFEVELVGF